MTKNKSYDYLSDEKLSEVCKNSSSNILALRVAIFRHLDLNKKLAIKCMEELNFRKQNGDTFNFEEYITKKISEFPPTQLDPTKKNVVLNMLTSEIKSFKNG